MLLAFYFAFAACLVAAAMVKRRATPFEGMFLVGLCMTCAIACGIDAAVPDRVPPVAKEAVPQIAGETYWGELKQNGASVTVSGPHWFGEGHVRKDGFLFLTWTQLSTGRTAVSCYDTDNGVIDGAWVFVDEGEVQGTAVSGKYHLEYLRGDPEDDDED